MKHVFNPKRPEGTIHGHTKIILTDAQGNSEVIEKDNIITNLPNNIFAHNLYSGIDFMNLLPINKVFDGCLLYNNPENEATAETTLVPYGSTIVAHAGNEAYSGNDPTAGNPNEIESTKLSNGYRWVWDWASSQGNGTLNTVSLLAGKLGALGRNEVEHNLPPVFTLGHAFNANYFDHQSKPHFQCRWYDWGKNFAYNALYDPSVKKLTVYKYRFCGSKIYVNSDPMEYDLINTFEYTLNSSFNTRLSGQLVGGELWFSSLVNSNSICIVKLNPEDGSFAENVYSYSGVSFLEENRSVAYQGDIFFCSVYPINENYIYIAKADGLTYYKCNLDILADVVELPSNMDHSVANSEKHAGIALHNGNAVFYDHMIANDKVYQTQAIGEDYYFLGGGEFGNSGVCYYKTFKRSYGDGTNNKMALVLPAEAISTINLLANPVVKTAEKSMKLIYTITID